MKTTLKIVAIFAICAATLMSGCLESTDEYGTHSYNIIADTTVTDVDYYGDGLHITGKAITRGGECVRMDCVVDGYIDGCHVTGTMTQDGLGEPWYTMTMEIDAYESGLHTTGQLTCEGSSGTPRDWGGHLVVDGYRDGIHITGTAAIYGADTYYYDCCGVVDTYMDGAHVTGTMSLRGYDTEEWYCDLTAQRDGYLTQYKTGRMDSRWTTR